MGDEVIELRLTRDGRRLIITLGWMKGRKAFASFSDDAEGRETLVRWARLELEAQLLEQFEYLDRDV